MLRHKGIQIIAGIGVILVLTFGVMLLTADRSDAQPQFREFSPPQNPVDPSVNHRFDFPGNVQAELRVDQRGRGPAYSGYVEVWDDSETVSMMVPAQWNDVEISSSISGDQSSGISISASSDLVAYEEGAAPGVTLVAVPTGTAAESEIAGLNGSANTARDSCNATQISGQAYEDPFFSGQFDVYRGCKNGASQIVLSAVTGAGDARVLIQGLIMTNADLDAVKTIFDSFQVLGVPGVHEEHGHGDEH